MGKMNMDIALLKHSFESLASQKEAFAQSFYQRLFIRYPQVQQLFANTDMKRQKCSFAVLLELVIAGLERGDNLTPALQALGARHHAYGAQETFYLIFGEVLLETLNEHLGPMFTYEVQEAWKQLYEFISRQMQSER